MPGRAVRKSHLSVVLLAAGLAACASAPRAGPPAVEGPCAVVPLPPASEPSDASKSSTAPDESAVPDESAAEAPPIVIGLPGPVDRARAPFARNESERLVFSHLYEPLVRVTCDGRVEPALASSWREEDDGRSWRFTLRSDARDWEGTPVTTAEVVSSWVAAGAARGGEESRAEETDRGPAEPGEPDETFVALTVEDAHTFRVEVPAPVTEKFFARSFLAVQTGLAASGWPGGTGPYRPHAGDRAPGRPDGSVLLSSTRGGLPLEFRIVSGDPRNALDAGLDLLVTSSPGVIEYAASSADFGTVPLGWNRGYLLLAGGSPTEERFMAETGRDAAARPDTVVRGVVEARPAEATGPAPAEFAARVWRAPQAALAALARDAVRGEVRPSHGLGGNLGACLAIAANIPEQAGDRTAADRGEAGDRTAADRGEAGDTATGTGESRIVYPAGDPVSRALAERLVALALDSARPDAEWIERMVPGLAGAGASLRAAGLPGPRFESALRAGTELAYVVATDRGPGMGRCHEIDGLVSRAPWLAAASPGPFGPGAGSRPTERPAIVPLLDARNTLIVRHGVSGVAVDGRGTLLLEWIRRDPPASGVKP